MALYVKALLAAMVAFAPGTHCGPTDQGPVAITREKTGVYAQGYVDFDFTSKIQIKKTDTIALRFYATHFKLPSGPLDCYMGVTSVNTTTPAIGGKTTCVVTTAASYDTATCTFGGLDANNPVPPNQKIKVRCLGVKNVGAVSDATPVAADTLQLIDATTKTALGSNSNSTNLPAIVMGVLSTSKRSVAFAQHSPGVSTTATFKFSVPFGVDLPLGGATFIFYDLEATSPHYGLAPSQATVCTSPDFVLSGCTIINVAGGVADDSLGQRSELVCNITKPAKGASINGVASYTGEYLTVGEHWDVTITCQVTTGSSIAARKGQFGLTRIVSGPFPLAMSNKMEIAAYVATVANAGFAFEDLTKDRHTPTVFGFHIYDFDVNSNGTVTNDVLWVQLPRGTGLCTSDDVGRTLSAISGCTNFTTCTVDNSDVTPLKISTKEANDVLVIPIGARAANFTLVCKDLKNSWRVGDSSFTSWYKVYNGSTLKSSSYPMLQGIPNFVLSPISPTPTTRPRTYGRLLCFGGGLQVDDRAPVCSYQGAKTTNDTDAAIYYRAPTMQFKHAGHSFIEWNDMICAAGGGLFEGLSNSSSIVSKKIECWDKHPQHSWVQVTTPPAATANEMETQASTLTSRLLDGSAAVSWRGMICLTGGVLDKPRDSTDVRYTTGFKKIYFSTGTACTDDGNTWKHSVETPTAPVLAMPQARAYHSAASFQGKLCVSGGYNLNADYSGTADITYLTSVLCTSTGQLWQSFGELSAARSSHSMVVFRGELCVVGGSAKFSYSNGDAFALECTADGDDWRLYDGPKKNIRTGGVAVDPTGVLFVPTLDDSGGWAGVSSYDEQGWRGVDLSDSSPWRTFSSWRGPAAFSFTATTGSWSAQGEP